MGIISDKANCGTPIFTSVLTMQHYVYCSYRCCKNAVASRAVAVGAADEDVTFKILHRFRLKRSAFKVKHFFAFHTFPQSSLSAMRPIYVGSATLGKSIGAAILSNETASICVPPIACVFIFTLMTPPPRCCSSRGWVSGYLVRYLRLCNCQIPPPPPPAVLL